MYKAPANPVVWGPQTCRVCCGCFRTGFRSTDRRQSSEIRGSNVAGIHDGGEEDDCRILLGGARPVIYRSNITDGYVRANYSQWCGTWQDPSALCAYELCSSVLSRGLRNQQMMRQGRNLINRRADLLTDNASGMMDKRG